MVCYCIMSKKRLTEMSVDQPQKSQSIDWDKCIFCQHSKDEAPQWPLGTKRSDIYPLKTDGKAASVIQEFDKIGSLPMPLNVALLDEGKGIILQHLLIIKPNDRLIGLKLDREISKSQKQKSSDIYTSPDTKKATRQSCTSTNISKESCFFCVQISREIHLVSTLHLNRNVRKCAIELQDIVLLAKLAAGDMISQDAVHHRACLVG